MDLEKVQLSPGPHHQVQVDPDGVPPHVELPQPLALVFGGHLLQQVVHCLKAQTTPEIVCVCMKH